jgi:hypothetical protein
MGETKRDSLQTAIEFIETGGAVGWESDPIVRRIFRAVITRTQIQEMIGSHEPCYVQNGYNDESEL